MIHVANPASNPMVDELIQRAQVLVERGLHPRAYPILLFLEDLLGEDERVREIRERMRSSRSSRYVSR